MEKFLIKITLAIIIICIITFRTHFVFTKYETDMGGNDNNIQSIIVNSDVSFKNGKQKFVVKDLKTEKQYLVDSYETDYIKPYQCYTLNSYKLQSLDNHNFSSNKNEDDIYKIIKIPSKYYYAKDGITYKILIKDKTAINCDNNIIVTIKSVALNIRKYLIEKFLYIYDQPYAGFVAGILVAGKGLMSDETLSMFKKINLSHVVVLSGSNVAIIVSAMAMLASKFSSGLSYKIILIISVLIFSSITGFDPPILRATLSALFVILLKEKIHSSIVLLFIVAFIMFVINPIDFIFNPSTHLTFLATASLLFYNNFIHTRFFKIFYKIFEVRFSLFITEIISTTLSTQILIFVYILALTGGVSVVFLISNILILPVIPLVMFFGFLSLFTQVIFLDINNLLLSYIFFISEKLASLDYALLFLNKEQGVYVYPFYIIAFVVFNIYVLKSKK